MFDSVPDNEWLGRRDIAYFVTQISSLHFGEVFLKAYPEYDEELRQILEGKVATECVFHKDGRKGIKADLWEVEVKRRLEARGWKKEITVRDGVLFSQTREGERFDFGKYDLKHNLANFWSLCYGRRALADGPEAWKNELRKPTRRDWKAIAADMEFPKGGQDFVVPRHSPTILGELQKGNWGLAQRDFFKLVGAQIQVDVDLYVYVVPDGSFAALLSEGIVTRELVLKRMPAYRHVVDVPSLILGVDCRLPG